MKDVDWAEIAFLLILGAIMLGVIGLGVWLFVFAFVASPIEIPLTIGRVAVAAGGIFAMAIGGCGLLALVFA